jgi:prefoldin alpha subunit
MGNFPSSPSPSYDTYLVCINNLLSYEKFFHIKKKIKVLSGKILITPSLIEGYALWGCIEGDHMTKEEEITRNLTLIEYYKQQLESIDLQIQYLQTTLADYQRAKMTVENLNIVTENTDLLIPIGGGTFVNGCLKNASNVLIGVGTGLIVEKPVGEAITKLDERIKRIQDNIEKMLSLGQKVQSDAEALSEKTQQMIQETQH